MSQQPAEPGRPAPLWATAPPGQEAPPVTDRLRRIVTGLPDWEPLPPGEAVVRRPGSER